MKYKDTDRYPDNFQFTEYSTTAGGITYSVIKGDMTREQAEQLTGYSMAELVAIDLQQWNKLPKVVEALTKWRDEQGIDTVKAPAKQIQAEPTLSTGALQSTMMLARLHNVHNFAELLNQITAMPKGWKGFEDARDSGSDATLVLKNREQLFGVLERLHASGVLNKLVENEHGELGVKITPRSDHITPIFTIDARQKGKIELKINHHTLSLHPEHMQPFADAATKDTTTKFAANEAGKLSPISLKARALIAKQNPTELAALLNEIMPANLPAKWTFQTHSPMQGGDSHTFTLRLPNGADSDAVIAALHEARVVDKNNHTTKGSIVEFASPGQRRSFIEFDMSGKTVVLTINDAFMVCATALPFEGMANYAQALKERGTKR